ncbi:MBL fold metallo-hydrolase [Streptomyces sp. AS02]|uniref:pyrroloquinoline quinone biosynthesis protein PqqB n=1 Tax=Streptomyces sp. AS02 TaxID=2938946 RepID=UPI00202069CD|nr:MBL fold metallo-hydrolase [Streptomyces sp. AS02]MCL8014891.1 MBL fold metallo-hydrolase [Streptomyces sp. AS02]
MLLKILGTAAGGGVPQWNCACPGCAGARAHPERARLHASLAVSVEGGVPFVVNATPDIRRQLEIHPDLHPRPGGERTPRVTVVLTDAELDHTLGIAQLREANELVVWSTAVVRDALTRHLRLDAVLAPYTNLTWRTLPETSAPDGGARIAGLYVEAVPLSVKRPRYAADAPPAGAWSSALRIKDPATGSTVLYAPALAQWSPAFEDAAAGADCVIVDGTFLDDPEPRRSGFSAKTATEMGHLPIHGAGGTAARLARLCGRCLYTHLNNSNPLLDPAAPQHKVLTDLGLEVAQDRMVIEL